MAKTPVLKIPKSLALAVDMYYSKREERLAKQREVDALEADEKMLKEHLINSIPKSNATGIAGKLCAVSVVQKDIPQVADWDKFYEYVAKNRTKGGFAMLSRSLSATAVKEVWEAGKEVPGVGHFTAVTLSVHKLK